MDPHYCKRMSLVAYISNQEIHIAKKGNFNSLHKQPKNHFRIKLPKKEILMEPTLQKAKIQLNKPHSPSVDKFAN